MWPWLFALLATANARAIDVLPHCSRTLAAEGEIKTYDDVRSRTKILASLQFALGLHETSCISIKGKNGTSEVVHAVEFYRLEQHHPVSGKYQFGIPKITPSCICDCAGGDSHCKMEDYNYKNCSSGALCYRTYHPVQSNIGCGFGDSKSEVCCQLQIDPYRDWRFTALRVGQPDTVLILKYSIVERPNMKWRTISEEFIELGKRVYMDHLQWICAHYLAHYYHTLFKNYKQAEHEIIVPMNKGNARFEFKNRHKIEISVTGGRPNRELLPGMYFFRDGTQELRSVPGLNDITTADISKLGWLRNINGKWVVPNGPVKMKEKFHVDVQDCKAQKYTSTFNGEQMITVAGKDQTDNFDLGQAVTADPWIERATFDSRVVRVVHAEGIATIVHMTTESKPTVIHTGDQFETFTGSIHMDSNSQQYVNITFFGSKGTFIGTIFKSELKEHVDMVLSVSVDSSQIRDYKTIVSIQGTKIDGPRYVCFHPSGDEEGEQCKWFSYQSEDMREYRLADGSQAQTGICFGCNDKGLEGVIGAFDPRAWMDGINSPKEALGMAIEFVAIGGMLLILVCMCTKCIIPLAKCSLWVPGSKK